MSHCPDFSHLLVLPHLRVQNANAISGPLTHGFPAMSAFLGLMWALQRKAAAAGLHGLDFRAVGVVCHRHQEQVSDAYIKTFHLTRNPIGKDGKTAAIVEEGRIHLEISLIFAVHAPDLGLNAERDQALAEQLQAIVQHMRIAGGSVLPPKRHQPAYWLAMTGDAQGRQQIFDHARMRLLPGFALVSRDDLLVEELAQQQTENPSATVLEAWLARARRNWRYAPDANAPEKGSWQHDRPAGSGWVVPIPVGYGALTPLQAAGSVAHARDVDTPFCFVESLYSLGQWIGPHRLHSPEQLLWYPEHQPEHCLYRCRNDYAVTSDEDDEIESIF